MQESIRRGYVIINGQKYGIDEQVSPKIAALFLGGKDRPVSVRTLSNWRTDRTGPAFYKLGDAPSSPVRYMIRDLIAYIEKYRFENGNGARRPA